MSGGDSFFGATLGLLDAVVAFDAAYCYVVDRDLTSRPVRLFNLDPSSTADYVDGFDALDPFHPRRTAACSAAVVTRHDVDVPEDVSHAYAEGFLRPLGVGPEVEVLVRRHGHLAAGLSLLRRRGGDEFSPAEVRLLGSVQPYVEYAFTAAAGVDDPGPEPPDALTDRQRQVAGLVGAGCSNKRIARQLGIAVPTVKSHLASISRVLGVSSRTEMVARLFVHPPPHPFD